MADISQKRAAASRRTRLAKTDAPRRNRRGAWRLRRRLLPDSTAVVYLKLEPSAEMRGLEASIETAETAERAKLTSRCRA